MLRRPNWRRTMILRTLTLGALTAVFACAANDGGEVEANATGTDAAYLFVTRSCAPGKCDGFFVKHANKAQTRCSDGVLSDECYVSRIDQAAMPAARRDPDFVSAFSAGRGLVRGVLDAGGVLRVTEAWKAAGVYKFKPGLDLGAANRAESDKKRPSLFRVTAGEGGGTAAVALNDSKPLQKGAIGIVGGGTVVALGLGELRSAVKTPAGAIVYVSSINRLEDNFDIVAAEFYTVTRASGSAPEGTLVTFGTACALGASDDDARSAAFSRMNDPYIKLQTDLSASDGEYTGKYLKAPYKVVGDVTSRRLMTIAEYNWMACVPLQGSP
ncbi:MAG: hypothetical protein HOO96_03625 [Polyangiaceae bacterium]|nr:hypothetical protein [Polyangiaceae bacterium]